MNTDLFVHKTPKLTIQQKNNSYSTHYIMALLLCLGICVANNVQALPSIEKTDAFASRHISHLHQKIIYQAMDLSKQAYKNEQENIPPALSNIGYQQYRSIRFLNNKSLWMDNSLFQIQLFHPGFLYKQPVKINEVQSENIINIPFSADFFRYDGESVTLRNVVNSDMGFSGFRVHYPLNSPTYKDELVVFQGASYFRPLGPGLQYGVSARGVAIDTAEPSGEEFPYFKEFWLVKPAPNENTMTFYALLDSPSVTGAYRFQLLPGIPTSIKVSVDIFARKDVKKLGIGALTSMFFYGENRNHHPDDFRPEVHDSDGLLIATSHNEWIWRPLSNPKQLHTNSFSLHNPKGFGLMQRDREFANYQDTEADYHRRPSVWVTPTGTPWGKGRVELVEIPTTNETNDNIVAYWVPDKKLTQGDHQHYEYSLHMINEPGRSTVGKVVQTRNGWGSVPGQDNPPPRSQRQFIVDFSGWPDNSISPKLEIEPVLVNSSGKVFDLQVALLPDQKTWRASFKIAPEGNGAVDMNLYLKAYNRRITETWSYVWQPQTLP